MYLYGASGHARVIIDIIEAQGGHIDGIIDDFSHNDNLLGYAVTNKYHGETPIIIAIGDNATRWRIAQSLHCGWSTAIHPSAIISPHAHIGVGTVVMQGAIIQSCATIGQHVIVNTSASIDHECRIGDFAHISPHATLCGNVTVGDGAWVAAGCIVLPGVKIGRWSVIGAGSVVSHDIPDGVLAVGNRVHVVRPINQDLLNIINKMRGAINCFSPSFFIPCGCGAPLMINNERRA